jgi:hypothetical protein
MTGRLFALVFLAGCNSILGIGDVKEGSTVDAPGPDAMAGVDARTHFTVYAHADHVLYAVDLSTNTLTTIGPFNAPVVGSIEDVITDLAVMPDDTIYAISHTALYTASPTDGHVSMVGSVTTCGMENVALTATPDGKLWAGDFKGAICPIDLNFNPPIVGSPVAMQGGLALVGDMVGIDNGTVFGTAYRLSDAVNMGTQINNVLVTVNVQTGDVVQLGTGTNFAKLYGAAFANGKVFAFTHDQTGRVLTIDPSSGVGTLYGTFIDPTTQMGISFAGAAVNPLVPPP